MVRTTSIHPFVLFLSLLFSHFHHVSPTFLLPLHPQTHPSKTTHICHKTLPRTSLRGGGEKGDGEKWGKEGETEHQGYDGDQDDKEEEETNDTPTIDTPTIDTPTIDTPTIDTPTIDTLQIDTPPPSNPPPSNTPPSNPPPSPPSTSKIDTLPSLHASLTSILSSPSTPPMLQFGRLYTSLTSPPPGHPNDKHDNEDDQLRRQIQELHSEKLRDWYGRLFESRLHTLPPHTTSPTSAISSISLSIEREITAAVNGAGGLVGEDTVEGWKRDVEVLSRRWREDREEKDEEEEEGMEEIREGEEEAPGGLTMSRFAYSTKRYIKSQLNGRIWVKRFINQAIVIGLNYAQMKLEYRGRKREELKRERETPKFPFL